MNISLHSIQIKKSNLNAVRTIVVLMLISVIFTAKGQLAADCSTAKPLTINTLSMDYPISGNPGTLAPINCTTGTVVKEGWCYFTATTDYSVVTFQNTGKQKGYLYVYTGACDAMTYVKCMGIDSADVNLLNIRTIKTQKYYIRVVQVDAANAVSGIVGVFANSGTKATLCKPDKIGFATASVDSKGTKTDGDVFAGIDGQVLQDNLIDGYIKFNTSAMPKYKTTTKELYLNLVNKSSMTTFGATRMIITKMKNDTLDPVTAKGIDIFQQLKATTNMFFSFNSMYSPGIPYSHKLLAAAITNFDSRNKQGWWGILLGLDYNSLYNYGDGHAFYGWNTKKSPYLIVTYSVGNYSETGIICGASVQLDANTECGAIEENKYKWEPADGLSSDTVKSPIAKPNVTTLYKVTVSNSICTSVDSAKVIVNPLTVTGTDVTLNCGVSSKINTTTNYTGTDNLQYSWTPETGLDDSHAASPTVTGKNNLTYNVKIETPNGCTANDDVTVKVNTVNISPAICMVGVDDQNKNKVIWNKPVSAAIDSFIVYRETNVTDVYAKVGGNAYNDYSVFVDVSSNPDIQSNKYRMSIKDMCGNETVQSAFHKTIHLAINQGMGTTWNLIWETYTGFTVSTYNIYRGTNQNDLQQIGSVAGSSYQYTDVNAPGGNVFYQIEAINPAPCTPSKSAENSTRSNIAKNNITGISNLSAEDYKLNIMPNPVNRRTLISWELAAKSNVSIKLYNITGRLVKIVFEGEEDKGTRSINLDMSGFGEGLYFMRMSVDNNTITKKIVKY